MVQKRQCACVCPTRLGKVSSCFLLFLQKSSMHRCELLYTVGRAHDRNEKYGHIIFSKGLLSDSTRYTGREILAEVEKNCTFLHVAGNECRRSKSKTGNDYSELVSK